MSSFFSVPGTMALPRDKDFVRLGAKTLTRDKAIVCTWYSGVPVQLDFWQENNSYCLNTTCTEQQGPCF